MYFSIQAGALYFVPYCNPGTGAASGAGSTKPVTVRSVKRRDRSKSVERTERRMMGGGRGAGDTAEAGLTESRPVMV